MDRTSTSIKPLAIQDAQTTDQDSGWYAIDGRKLNGQPTVKGLYIHGGKKTVIP
jgi:hypothetical protein